MRGTTPGFWKKYERQQMSMIASCMPRAAKRDGVKPMEVQKPLAVCTLPGQASADTFELR